VLVVVATTIGMVVILSVSTGSMATMSLFSVDVAIRHRFIAHKPTIPTMVSLTTGH
jgi:hypothetical protein